MTLCYYNIGQKSSLEYVVLALYRAPAASPMSPAPGNLLEGLHSRLARGNGRSLQAAKSAPLPYITKRYF
jgi:hypothetical protein